MADIAILTSAYESANVLAWLRALRLGETAQDEDAYRWLFGSTRDSPKLFDGFDDHPRIRTYEAYDGQFVKNGKIDYTTAAGAYQIVASTWDPTADKWGLEDFSPRNQDLCAIALTHGRGALQDVIAGRIEVAAEKCKKEWASLPTSDYGQPTVSMAGFKQVYEEYGGTYSEQAVTQEKPVAPFIAAAIPAIISAVPELIKVFGTSPTAEKNTKAAEIVVQIAKDAIGAKNEQELIEAMAADPKAVEHVKEAVLTNWFQLQEVGGGIAVAREANLKAQGERGIRHNPALWISVMLLPLVYLVVWKVLEAPVDVIGAEVKSMVIGAVLGTALGGIVAYWLGTSNSSAKKDEALMAKK